MSFKMSIKSRRIIALLLCFLMVFSAMPISAFAAEDPLTQITEQSETEVVVSPDDVTADIDEQTTTEDNPTADVDNEPAVEDETPAVEEETPVAEDATPAVEEETPVAEDETPAVEEETPAVEDEIPAVEEDTPAVEEETPAVEEEIPAIDEIPVLGGAITEQYGIMLLNEAVLLGDVEGTVYISVSHDGQYVDDANGEPVAYVPVEMSDLLEIDLAGYGLTDYNYDNQLTALHLYIYTHENIIGGDWNDVGVSGGAGSIFFENGLFGFTDCNLQYYCNGEYPEVDGWGITADQLVLNDGDFFDVAAYTSWAFFSDSAFGFHYFLDGEEITHEYTATAGEALTVTLGRGASYMGGEDSMTKVADYTVSYGAELGAADGTATTNAEGQAEITFAEAGDYYIWVDGGYGAENPDDIVSAPGYAEVTVEEGEAPAPVTYTVTLPTEAVGYTVAATEDSVSPVTEGGNYSFTVVISEGYEAGENFAVKANDVVLNAVESVYTIANITAEQTVTVEGVVEKVKEPTPFSQKVTVPSNGNSSWGYVSGLTLSGDDGAIYETYWSSESEPYVLDVILAQGTPLDTTITAAFTVAGLRAPSISGDTTVALVNGSGKINVVAKSWNTALYSDTNWTINLIVDDGSAANRPTYEVELPTETVGYTVTAYNSVSPVITGRTFSFKVTIDGDYKKGENFKVLANGVEITGSSDVYTITNITEKQTVTVEGVVAKTLADKSVTIVAPADSIISCGRFYSYFKYDFSEPLETNTLEDGRLSYIYAPPGSESFLRVQHPGGVTYWDFERSGFSAGSSFEITEEMLFIGSDEFTKETVYADFEKNIKDKADLYMTVNAQGWLDMASGDTHSLNVFRNWIPVANSIQNNGVSLPDVEYKVVSVDGSASDVVTVTPDANNSCYADIKANSAGTAIILVTYDAVYNNDGEGGKQFSAIWPENTGVIVVTVDAEDADIATNMTVNEEANAGGKQVIDVEHDILFYVDEAGAKYSFKPEDGCTVSVARSTVGKEMTFNGFTDTGVAVVEDGTVTVSGLTTGTHIIKVEKDGKAAYQVIRAREVSYELLDSDGNAINAENPADPGETVTVQFHNLISPLEKLSGVYNANFGFWYNGQDGDAIRTSGGTYGVYNFSGNENLQKFTVTVPSYWNEETYTLTDGGIKLGGFGGSFGAHRSTSYMVGKEVNTNASGTGGVASVLPDIIIPTTPTGINVYYVTLPEGEGYTVTGGETPITEGESYTFTVAVKGGYDGNGIVVKVNGEAVTGTDGSYTVENVMEDIAITVEGVTKVNVATPSETTTVYTNGTDGSNWTDSTVYVDTVAIGGADVKVESYSWDGNTCTVKLAEDTPVNADVVFVMAIGGSIPSWFKSATLNDTAMSVESPCSVTLVDGKATATLSVTARGRTEAKTFVLTGAAGEEVIRTYTVTLPAETVGYTVAATEDSVSPVTEGGSYSFNVAISDGYEAGENFAVKANDVVLTAVEDVYTISNITADQTVTVDGVVEKEEETSLTWQEVMAKTEAYLTTQGEDKAPGVGSTKGEWQVLGLARNDVEADFYDAYYANVVEYVKENIDAETGRLHTSKSTDNSRIILALTSLGKDVTNVGGHDLLLGLSDTDYVKKQGINGPVWALIALDSGKYDIPANADSDKQVTREWLIDYILEKQLTDGGWTMAGTTPDDMTPMAVQALAPYYESDTEVKAAVDKALTVMTTMSATPETYAQIIVALSALGIDCETNEQFVTDGVSVLDKMLAFAMEDGSFQKSLTSGANQMSTEQAFYAMVAYDRFLDGKTSLYDMTDVEIDGGDEPIIEVDGITLSDSSASVKVGKTVTVTVVVSPDNATNKTVTWTSSDTNIATVENGTITGVSEGTATVTATIGEFSATCTVTVTKVSGGGSSGGSTGLDFGLNEDEIEGYVYVSFEDKGKRKAEEKDEIESQFRSPLGTIISRTKVPFKADDTIASVTLRLLEAKEFDASYEGDEFSNFYLEAIGDFTVNGTHYDSFGEFDAGQDSGWMITWNDWFIDQGASEFTVKNGDVIKWQYTCQLGADIGDDYFERDESSGGGAAITGEDRAAAKEVKELIEAIGTVDENSKKAIEAARAAYEALTEEQKDLVPNLDVLKEAEKAYAELTGETIAPAESDFADVKDHWAADAIQYAADKGLMTGVTENSFAPEQATNRAMITTILYRLAGSPAVEGNAAFTDIANGTWYSDAIRWAEMNKIVGGYADGSFGPNDNITREQLASILYRFAAANGRNMNAAADLTGFADADTIGEWALTAMQWANAEGLITGKTGNVIDAKGNATRAEVATILMRYLENIAK